MRILVKGYFDVPDDCDGESIDNVFTLVNSELMHMGIKGQINELGNPENRPQVRMWEKVEQL